MPFFRTSATSPLEVLRIASWKTIEAGTSIVKEGERADSFYLLVDGEARVTLQGMH